MGNLATPENIQKLQTALHAKAKGEPGFRFYSLYDKVYLRGVLEYAYACCRANQGAAGVDGERFEDIEVYGVERWLGELADTLRTIRDRTAMMAATLILAPIFEADLPPEQHGYRPERSALSGVKETHGLLVTGRTQVVDADLTDYFGSIPHAQLMTSVVRRVVDRQVLHLLKMWLEAPVDETDDQGRTRRTTRNKDSKRGIPQGSPISPLLSNLHRRRLVLGWKRLGYERRFDARTVSYADDLVICCRHQADEALVALRQVASRIGLTVNEDKTHVCRLPEGRFTFLGYSFERCYSEKTGRSYLGTRPSKKSIQRMVESISAQTERKTLCLDADIMVARLKGKLVGWANYQWEDTIPGTAPARDTRTGLSAGTDPQPPMGENMSSCPRAECVNSARSVRRAGSGNGIMERLLGHRRPKGPATDKPHSCHYRATSRLHQIIKAL